MKPLLSLLAGVLGALLVTWLREAPPAVVLERPASVATPPPVTPPAWDAIQAQRLASLEKRMEALQAQAKTATPSEVERIAQYTDELSSQQKRFAEHDAESLNSSWAADKAAQIREDLKGDFELTSVSCRSRTCIVTMHFEAPNQALTYLQQIKPTRACTGMVAIPEPPTGDGPYDLRVFYDCIER